MNVTSLNDVASLWLDVLWTAAWQGAIVTLLVLVICRMFPRIPARYQCWLWRLVFLKLLLSCLWTSPVQLPWLPVENLTEPTAHISQLGNDESEVAANLPDIIATESLSAVNSTEDLTFSSWLMFFWIGGVALSFAKLLMHWMQVRNVRMQFSEVKDPQMFMMLKEVCSELNVTRSPEIRILRKSVSPFLVDGLRPVVVLPESLVHPRNVGQLKAALLHEVAHVKRRDLLWNWLPVLSGALFFFHPFVWFAKRECYLAQEIATDEYAMSSSGLPVAKYADLLIQLAGKYNTVSCPNLTVAVTETYSQLSKRLIAMKTFSKITPRYHVLLTAAVFVIGVFGVVPWKLTAEQLEGTSPSEGLSTQGENAKKSIPSKEAKVLDRLVGTWSIEVDRDLKLPSGIQHGATVVVKWILQERFLELQVINSDGKLAVQELMTYDSNSGLYKIWAFDQFLSKPAVVSFRWNESKQSFKGSSGGVDEGLGITAIWEMTFQDKDQISVNASLVDVSGKQLKYEIKAKMLRQK